VSLSPLSDGDQTIIDIIEVILVIKARLIQD